MVVEVQFHVFLILILNDEWSASRHCHFTLGVTASGIHYMGEWEDTGAGADVTEKQNISCPCRESNPNSSVIEPIV
jgi:hypothetical protein